MNMYGGGTASSSNNFKDSERWDYERLKKLELRGLEDYQAMRKAPTMSPEAVVSFINQLSPWNLKTTGLDILEAYTSDRERLAKLQDLNILKTIYYITKSDNQPEKFEAVLRGMIGQIDKLQKEELDKS